MTQTVDVLVVGAGPTGLTVAGDLAREGRSVAVLERWPEINPSSRAFTTMARTLEVFDARGFADELVALGEQVTAVNLFAGARIDQTRVRSRFKFVLVTPQTNVDAAIGRYAQKHGAEIHRGIEVVALEQDGDGVTVTARPKDDADPAHAQTWRATYLVAADGARSTVRDLIGADFPGETVLSSLVLADVRLLDGPTVGLKLGSIRNSYSFLAPYGRTDEQGGAWYRSLTWDRNRQLPDSEPPTFEEVERTIRASQGRDHGLVEIGWMSRFHCDERQATQYRHGRVFLAGDAAHMHSPMGGQGMNTSIQDGANLAWKLSAVLGGAPDRVLDTYHDERHPVGQEVLERSHRMMRAITLKPRPARALRNLVAPRLLRIPKVQDAMAGSFSATTLRYGTGPVGERASEIPLTQGRLAEVQRTPGFVLVLARDAADVDGVRTVRRSDDGPSVLVRPDGYSAWVASPEDQEGWRAALSSWTGR